MRLWKRPESNPLRKVGNRTGDFFLTMTVNSAGRTADKRGINQIMCDTCVTKPVISFYKPCIEYKWKEVTR